MDALRLLKQQLYDEAFGKGSGLFRTRLNIVQKPLMAVASIKTLDLGIAMFSGRGLTRFHNFQPNEFTITLPNLTADMVTCIFASDECEVVGILACPGSVTVSYKLHTGFALSFKLLVIVGGVSVWEGYLSPIPTLEEVAVELNPDSCVSFPRWMELVLDYEHDAGVLTRAFLWICRRTLHIMFEEFVVHVIELVISVASKHINDPALSGAASLTILSSVRRYPRSVAKVDKVYQFLLDLMQRHSNNISVLENSGQALHQCVRPYSTQWRSSLHLLDRERVLIACKILTQHDRLRVLGTAILINVE